MASIQALIEQYEELVTRAEQLPEQDYATLLRASAGVPDNTEWTDGLTLDKDEVVREIQMIRDQLKLLLTTDTIPRSQKLMLVYQLNHTFGHLRDAINVNLQGTPAWTYVNQIHNIRSQFEMAGLPLIYADGSNKQSSSKVLQLATREASQFLLQKVEVDTFKRDLQTLLKQAKVDEKSIDEVKALVEQHRLDIKVRNEDVLQQQVQMTGTIEAINEAGEKCINSVHATRVNEKQSMDLIEKIKDRADLINRKSLGGAYEAQKVALGITRRNWNIAFIFSLLALAASSLFATSKAVAVSDAWTLTNVLIKVLPVSGALIWLAWHCASKAAAADKVAEDYAFKVAAAISFEGYKKEVEGDAELKKALLQKTIHTFGENPIRLYPSGKQAHSPMEELFQLTEDERKSFFKLLLDLFRKKNKLEP
jgi:hypothetical protein